MNLSSNPDSVTFDPGQLHFLRLNFPLLYNKDNKTLHSGKLQIINNTGKPLGTQ